MCARCLSPLLAGYHPWGVLKFMKNEKLSPVCVSVSDVMRPDFVEPARVPPQHLLEFSCTPSLSFVFITRGR